MRVETTHHTLYQYSELSDKAKQRAREDYARMNGEHWDGTDMYDDFKQCATRLGITFKPRVRHCPANSPGGARASNPITDPPCIWWSGFSSQGDGACFEGRYAYAEDAPAKIREYAPQDKTLHVIADGLNVLQAMYGYTLTATVSHSGHYYHAYSTTIEWSAQTADGEDDRAVSEDDQKTGTALLRDFMRWLYAALEADYTYQTGEKYADELLSEGDYEFTEDGKIA